MRAKDITPGMKVVPVIKTVDGPLGKSKEWAKAKEKGQGYLWVLRANAANKVFTCAADKGAAKGEQFAPIDLRALDWAGWPSRAPGAVHVPKGDKPAAKKPATKKPAVKKAPAKKPVKKVAAKKPAAPKAPRTEAEAEVESIYNDV